MSTLDSLVAGGDPVDADLVSLLLADGCDTLDDVRARGRVHWEQLLADRAGFTRDFVEYPRDYGLSWEQAADAEPFQCSADELEIGAQAASLAADLGVETFGELFRRSPESIRAALANGGHLMTELDDLLARHSLAW